jgi:hypothetical protein
MMSPQMRCTAILILLLAAAPVAAADLCADSRIPAPAVKHREACKSEDYPLQRAGGTATATLVRLTDGMKYSGGGYGSGGTPINRFFLRTPEDRIVALGSDLPQLHSLNARFHILQGLGIEPGRAGGLEAIPEKELYTRVLREDAARGVCVIYRMRPPLRGEVLDCDGTSASGEVSYAPGTLPWRQAIATACRGDACDPGTVRASRIARGADGALRYVVELPGGRQISVNAATGKAER